MHPASADEMTGYRSKRGKTPGRPPAPWRPLTRPLIAPINGHQVAPVGRRRAPGRGAGPGSHRGRMPAATVRHSAAFRLLALCPGPEVTTGLAATVLDVSPAPARKLLEKLVMAGLIEPGGCDWWRFHDLAYLHTQSRCKGWKLGQSFVPSPAESSAGTSAPPSAHTPICPAAATRSPSPIKARTGTTPAQPGQNGTSQPGRRAACSRCPW